MGLTFSDYEPENNYNEPTISRPPSNIKYQTQPPQILNLKNKKKEFLFIDYNLYTNNT